MTTAPDAGDDDNRAIATLVRCMHEANERTSCGCERVAVQIQARANLNLAAPNAAFAGAILRR